MFLPSKIEKIRIVLPKRYYDSAVTLIGELGFIQVEALENDAKKVTREYKELDYETINRHGQRIRSLKNNLIKQSLDDMERDRLVSIKFIKRLKS